MHRLFAALILVAAFAFFALPAESAKAQCYGGWGGGYGVVNPNAYGNGYWPYTLNYVPVPPYFALHPPVYYSYPVSRTYGASPYPYTPMQEPVYELEPVGQEIVNPYVIGAEAEVEPAEPADDRVISHQRVILNPYVDQPGEARVAEAG